MDDHLFQRNEVKRVVDGNPTGPVGWHFDARKPDFAVDRVAHFNGKAEAQVADKRKWVAGINGQRREDWVDFPAEKIGELLLLVGCQFVVSDNSHTLFSQTGEDFMK